MRVILAVLAVALATSAQDQAADKKAIKELHQQIVKATLSRDIETLVSFWTDDIVIMIPGRPPIAGKAANRAVREADLQPKQSLRRSENKFESKLELAGDYAFEWGTGSSSEEPYEGEATRQQFNFVQVLKRMPDGSWKVHRRIWNDGGKGDKP